MTEIALIAALARNRAIGLAGRMPWHLPDDLKRFKQLTLGHAVVMGRKTYESIGRPLPGRANLIVSRQLATPPAGCELYDSLQQALASRTAAGTVFVIGGGEIYALALPLARRMFLTHIDADFPGDTFFPPFDASQWRETARTIHRHAGAPPFDYAFVDYERVAAR